MYNTITMDFLQQIKNGKNPQELMMSYLENHVKGTPLGENILTLAKNNNQNAIEEIVRNISLERGIDFDKEFPAFKRMLGL